MSDTAGIRWRRGFFRAWLVFSTIWFAIVFLLVEPLNKIENYREDQDILRRATAGIEKFQIDINDGGLTLSNGDFRDVDQLKADQIRLNTIQSTSQRRMLSSQNQLVSGFSVAIGIPTLLLVFGIALAWIIRGFGLGNSASITKE